MESLDKIFKPVSKFLGEKVDKTMKELDLRHYTLEDVIKETKRQEENQPIVKETGKREKKEVLITAIKKSHGQEDFFWYQAMVIVGEKLMEIGKPLVYVYPNNTEPENLEHMIKGIHSGVYKILLNYVKKLGKKGIDVVYRDFDRSY